LDLGITGSRIFEKACAHGCPLLENGTPSIAISNIEVCNSVEAIMQCIVTSAAYGLVVLCLLIPCTNADEAAHPGALVIVGGGQIPDEVRDSFVALAGGKSAKIVIVPTASESADKREEGEGYLKPWRKYSPASLTLLHTRERARAEDPAFVKPITEATGIWFGGGDQVKLVAAYRGTAVEREFKSLFKRGGVIGGTSAGAAVMSDVMIEGGNPKPDVGRGFGFITNAVVDQHFLRRSRLNRLLAVISEKPNLIGIGIDEGTAFILQGDEWRVAGRSYVVAFALDKDGNALRLASFAGGDRGTYQATGLPILTGPPRSED
jgi:cyanophycinase